MQACLITFLVLSFARSQESQVPQQPPEHSPAPYVERDQRQFNFYPGGKLQIDTGVSGNVRVTGWERSSVLLQVERIIYHLPQDEARALAAKYPIVLRWTQTSATVRTSGPPQAAANMEMNLTLYVPRERTDIKAQILQGDLVIGAVNGWIEANLEDGSIEAKSMSGYFSAVTKQGNLDVEMAEKRWSGYEFSAATQRGSAALLLPADYSASLLLETRNGNIRVDYPEQTVDGESVPLLVTEKKNARSLSAKIGGGGARVKLWTASGDIALTATK